MPFLKRANGEQSGQCIEIKGDEFLLGRAPDCDLILDPCSGSGTTGAAAIELERRFVGIERNAERAEQSRRRLAEVRTK